MVKKNRKNNWKLWVFFWTLLMLMLTINFTGISFGVTNTQWHLFLHMGLIIFSFLILIYSLKLNDKAIIYIIFGSLLWIIVNCILFLARVFVDYIWLETNLFTFLGMVAGGFLIMVGFKEAVND